jgi:hypothetical protein
MDADGRIILNWIWKIWCWSHWHVLGEGNEDISTKIGYHMLKKLHSIWNTTYYFQGGGGNILHNNFSVISNAIPNITSCKV